MKPLYLLADSQLLFRNELQSDLPALHSVWSYLETSDPLAAYIGASNGDAPEFYELFKAGMHRLGIQRCVGIASAFAAQDQKALAQADLILLAGGDPLLGWQVLQKTGMRQLLEEKYREGAVLMGTSAGAIHLSWECFVPDQKSEIPMMQLAPFTIDVHDEVNQWQTFRNNLNYSNNTHPALGIASGSGILYQPGTAWQQLGKAVERFR